MNINLPGEVSAILNKLSAHNHEAYIVGGCVRDSIRGVVPKDWDITTSALPSQVIKIFPRTVETGIKHGTVTVIINRRHFEVTTFRIDGDYLDNRRPETVTFSSNISDDLSRRDFTINAIAYNPQAGFVDPFDGCGDITRGIIRCVGCAKQRFGEDALRMLRAARFASQLGFPVENEAVDAIKELRGNIENISAERVREELGKLLLGDNIQALALLETTGLLPFMMQEHKHEGSLGGIIPLLKKCPANEPMRLALFFLSFGDKCEKVLRDMRFDNKTAKEVHTYVRFMHDVIPKNRYAIKKYLRGVPQDKFENLLTLQSILRPLDASQIEAARLESRDIQEKMECFSLKDLAVNGEDLVQAGVPRGKPVGDKLEELLDMVMREPEMNTKPILMKIAD